LSNPIFLKQARNRLNTSEDFFRWIGVLIELKRFKAKIETRLRSVKKALKVEKKKQ